MTISHVRTEVDAAGPSAAEAPADPAVPYSSASATVDRQEAQRFQALVRARQRPRDDDSLPTQTSGTRTPPEGDEMALTDIPHHTNPNLARFAEEERVSDDTGVPPPPPPLPDPVWWGDGAAGRQQALQVGAERPNKTLATTAAMRAERQGGAKIDAVSRRSFGALQAAMASLSMGSGKSSRFSVDSGTAGRIGFLVRRDQEATHVVLELQRDAMAQASELRKSVQSWLEARGNPGVRVAIALRAAAQTRRIAEPGAEPQPDKSDETPFNQE